MIEPVLAVAVIVYGIAGSLASLLQLRRMRTRSSSEDVSLGYFSIVGGGYVLWLAYGVAIENLPLIVVDALGGMAISATLVVAVRLRGRRVRSAPTSGAGPRVPARFEQLPAAPRR